MDVKWQTGVPLFFDDSYEHSVWNNTDQDRVVLLFDVWSATLAPLTSSLIRHPDLVPEEAQAIVTMFQDAEKQRKAPRP
jgi:aspartyl/asparaginyl beta-hydroxylase (cupin superfamily)